jgi:hypothetical protein
MKTPLLLSLALCCAPSLALADAQAERDGEDFAIYLQSVGGPLGAELCADVLPEKDSVGSAYQAWYTRNKESADRGRVLFLSKKTEAELREYEAWMLEDYRKKFGTFEPEKKLRHCEGLHSIFSSTTFK